MTAADDNGPEPGGDDLVAAEYVLGVLPVEDRQAAAQRIDRDAAFARLVDQWEERLSPMASEFAEVAPPESVKRGLDSVLFAAAAADLPRTDSVGFWQSLALWRGLAGLAVAGLAVVIALSFIAPPGTAPAPEGSTPELVASLAPNDSDVSYLAVYDPARRQVGLSHVKGERPQGKDFELWVIQGQNAPASLGVIPSGSAARLPVDQNTRAMIEAGAVFAITAEPPGGAPEGKPTGPIVAKGNLSSI